MEKVLIYVFSPSNAIGLKLKLVFESSEYIVGISKTLVVDVGLIELETVVLGFA